VMSSRLILPSDSWLTAAEAAAYLRVKVRTLLLWVRQGEVPAHRLSGIRRRVWRFLRSELDAMLLTSSAGSAERRQS
jgi:excisionase family DNA binding protein